MDDSSEKENPKCTICNRRKDNHQVMHPFSDPKNPLPPSQIFGKTRADRTGGSGRGPAMEQPQVSVQPFPFDPVLRMALIAKGILEPEDLTRAEQMMQQAMPQQMIQLLTGEK